MTEDVESSYFKGICFKNMKNPIELNHQLKIKNKFDIDECALLIKNVFESTHYNFGCQNCFISTFQNLPTPKNNLFQVF